MSMKKTDLVKHLAKKLDGRMKSAATPDRFAQGAKAAPKADKREAQAVKLVQVSCRLPADLATRLRERAVGQEGGVNAVIAQAVERWLQDQPQA